MLRRAIHLGKNVRFPRRQFSTEKPAETVKKMDEIPELTLEDLKSFLGFGGFGLVGLFGGMQLNDRYSSKVERALSEYKSSFLTRCLENSVSTLPIITLPIVGFAVGPRLMKKPIIGIPTLVASIIIAQSI